MPPLAFAGVIQPMRPSTRATRRALLNLAGNVIGVNTANSRRWRIGGVGFAVPSLIVARVARELIDNGRVRAPCWDLDGDR